MIQSFKPTGDYIYDKQVLSEIYETKYGIHDHVHSGSAMSSVTMHAKEVYTKDFLYESYLRTFIFRDIGNKLGISFDDYINKPRYEIESINKIVEEIDARKMRANESALDGIENSKSSKKNKGGLPDLNL